MKMSERFIGYIYKKGIYIYIYIYMVNIPRVVTEKSRNWSITTTTTSSNRGKRRFDFASKASEDLRSKLEGAEE
jgi:hypothetical protein